MASAAMELDVPFGEKGSQNYISVEVVYTIEFSTDEMFEDIDDGAIFVGLGFSWRKTKLNTSE